MATSNTSARGSRHRSLLSLCKCKSHCTAYNPSTGLYEGEGRLIPRTTRHNHSKDDRTLVLGRHRDPSQSNLSISPTSASQFQRSRGQSSSDPILRLRLQDVAEEDSELQVIAAELTWYGELPLTSPSTPLVFVNKPKHDYQWPTIPVDIMEYNSGYYALVESHRANVVFLSTEQRLCEIHANLTDKLERGGRHDHDLTDHVYDLFDLLQEQVSRLCKEKEYHWDLQRSRAEIMANNPTDATLVHNGKLSHKYSYRLPY